MCRHLVSAVSLCGLLLSMGCSTLPDELGQGKVYVDTHDELVRSSLRELFTQLDWRMVRRSESVSPALPDPVHPRGPVRRYVYDGETARGEGVLVMVSHEADRPAEVYISVGGTDSRVSKASRARFLRIVSQYGGDHAVRVTQPAASL